MRAIMTGAIFALTLTPAVAAQAPISAAELKRLEAAVPGQSWYPPGYYDARIAAEAELAESPASKGDLTNDWNDGRGRIYDVRGCGGYAIVPADADKATLRYGDTALEIARIRRDLMTVGYPAAVFAEPLAVYERRLVEQATARSEKEVLMRLGIGPEEIYDPLANPDPPPLADEAEPGAEPDEALAAAIEANRRRLAPKLPAVVAEGGCGDAPPAPVIVRTEPPGANVMLISAFAFKVCTRKLANPWDRFACRWTEVETGKPTEIRGRSVYQIRWPDGTERRGTREFDLNYNSGDPTTETFRKTGS